MGEPLASKDTTCTSYKYVTIAAFKFISKLCYSRVHICFVIKYEPLVITKNIPLLTTFYHTCTTCITCLSLRFYLCKKPVLENIVKFGLGPRLYIIYIIPIVLYSILLYYCYYYILRALYKSGIHTKKQIIGTLRSALTS